MSVAVPMVRALIEVVERAGVPRREFLNAVGLAEDRLADGDGRLTLQEFDAVQRGALDLTGDETLGFRLAELGSQSAFAVVGNLISLAPTLRDALEIGLQFGSLLFSDVHQKLEESVDLARFRHDFQRTSARADRMHAEFVIAGLCRLIGIFAGPEARISGAYFEHAAPKHHAEYSRLFKGAERFNQSFTGIEFPREFLDVRQLHHDPRLYGLIHAEARRSIDTVERDPSHAERLRRYLSARPPGRMPNMQVAARELGMSVRSLRRRLAEEGVSYRALVQARLEEAAIQALQTPGRSVQEAAFATGFSDCTAFHRAFKHWTGVTPAEFQRRSGASH
jgi:AraC-like DNA-binding protein